MEALIKEQDASETDYVLAPNASAWITVDNISVWIRRTDEGVVVDLYPVNGEMEESLASTYAFFEEAMP